MSGRGVPRFNHYYEPPPTLVADYVPRERMPVVKRVQVHANCQWAIDVARDVAAGEASGRRHNPSDRNRAADQLRAHWMGLCTCYAIVNRLHP